MENLLTPTDVLLLGFCIGTFIVILATAILLAFVNRRFYNSARVKNGYKQYRKARER